MVLFNTVDGTGTLYGTVKNRVVTKPKAKPKQKPKTRVVPVAPRQKTPVTDLGQYVRNQQIRQSAPKPPPAPPKPSGPSQAELIRQAEARAEKARKEAEEKARKAANRQARTTATQDIERLNAQISGNIARRRTNEAGVAALRELTGGGHARVRDAALAQLDQALDEKLSQLRATYEASLEDFQQNLRDNEASEHDSSFANLANRARERQDLVGQALSVGAGESDVLRTQLQAIRNWASNQADVNRSFFDTQSSIVAGITDLGESTRTGMVNEELSTNAARSQRWSDFYESQAQTYTELANLDQQNYLLEQENKALERQKGTHTGLLSWLDEGKNAEDYEPPKLKTTAANKPGSYTSEYAKLAAKAAGSTWTDPGLSKETKNFQGWEAQTGGLNSSAALAAQSYPGSRRRTPEGATLRRW